MRYTILTACFRREVDIWNAVGMTIYAIHGMTFVRILWLLKGKTSLSEKAIKREEEY